MTAVTELPRRVRMQSVMDDVPAGKAEEPHFVQYVEHPAGTDAHLWYWALVGFAAAYGWRVGYVVYDAESPAPMGWALADGKSQRGHSHVVVCHDGKLLHDPHPSDAWLVHIEGWFTLERLCPHGHHLCDGRPTTCLARESEALGLYENEPACNARSSANSGRSERGEVKGGEASVIPDSDPSGRSPSPTTHAASSTAAGEP